MSFLIEHGLLLDPSDVILLAWWTEHSTDYMERVHGLDPDMIERARKLQKAADRLLAVSQQRQPLAEVPSGEQSSFPISSAITAREAAEILDVDVRTIYRHKAQLGVLRETKPLLLDRRMVIRYEITHSDKRSAA